MSKARLCKFQCNKADIYRNKVSKNYDLITCKLSIYFKKIYFIYFKDILKKTLWIICEFSEIYQNEIKHYVDKQKIEELIRDIKSICQESDKEFVKYSEEVIYTTLY